MEFEYGCQITNKYSFLNESDVEDPSELLAKATTEVKEVAPAAKGKVAPAGKTTGQAGKAQDASKGGKPVIGKDGKKEPLKQQTENKSKQPHRPVGMPALPGSAQQQKSASGDQVNKDGKENTSSRNQQGNRDNQNRERRPPREGEQRGERRGDDNRPPRRRDGEEGANNRPPRRTRPEGGQGEGESGVVGEDRRGPRSGGNYGGARNNGANNRRGGERHRRPEGQEQQQGSREFDRHSGSDKTGVKAVDKKEGAGKGNWGTAEDELAAVEEQTENVEQTEQNQDWATQVEENEEKKGEEKEPDTNLMTLDEYKKLRQQADKKNAFNIRKPGEGEDLSKWGKTYALPKKAEDEEEDEDEEAGDDEDEDQHANNKKSIVTQIQIKFNEQPREKRTDRPPRGDRPPREPREPREHREPREPREHREPREPREPRDPAAADSPNKPSRQSTGGNRDRPERADRGDRGDRPQRRGPPGGSGPAGDRPVRSGPNRANIPRIEDEQDFPSLSKA